MTKKEIEVQYPKQTFYQKDYLFSLFTNKTDNQTIQIKQQLYSNPTLHYLLNAKIEDIENPFDEKQNDTADILVVKDNFYEIIDIKTRNVSKSAQPPNIISAFKLAQVCAKMLDNKEFDNFTINYFEIDWMLNNDKLICNEIHFACLFKAHPNDLYINWAAAMQIQFHVSDLDQSFNGTMKSWAKLYLKHFVIQAKKRADDMIKKFVKPFEKYID
ncbi:MAG: HincII family type II restriction endonuclease [Chitinophagales bacterium]|nr:HincII family type II restriction endonuclease [Chitinophagales bacterium]